MLLFERLFFHGEKKSPFVERLKFSNKHFPGCGEVENFENSLVWRDWKLQKMFSGLKDWIFQKHFSGVERLIKIKKIPSLRDWKIEKLFFGIERLKISNKFFSGVQRWMSSKLFSGCGEFENFREASPRVWRDWIFKTSFSRLCRRWI